MSVRLRAHIRAGRAGTRDAESLQAGRPVENQFGARGTTVTHGPLLAASPPRDLGAPSDTAGPGVACPLAPLDGRDCKPRLDAEYR